MGGNKGAPYRALQGGLALRNQWPELLAVFLGDDLLWPQRWVTAKAQAMQACKLPPQLNSNLPIAISLPISSLNLLKFVTLIVPLKAVSFKNDKSVYGGNKKG